MRRSTAIASLALLATLAMHAATATMVVVGYNGTVLTSSNGSAWSASNSGVGAALFDIATDGTNWVAVGSGGTILESDGPPAWSWTQLSSGTPEWLRGIAQGGGHWAAVGTGGTILTSDGPPAWSWTPQASPLGSANFAAIATNGTTWKIVANSDIIVASPGGPATSTWTWTTQNVMTGFGGTYTLRGIAALGPDWVAVGSGQNSPGITLTSTAGGPWTSQTNPQSLNRVATFGGQWAVAGDNGAFLTSSGPPWSWTAAPTGTTHNLRGVAACDLGAWTLTGDQGTLEASAGQPSWTWTTTSSSTMQHLTSAACTIPPLQCTPPNPVTLTGQAVTWNATGGIPPYTWTTPNATSAPSNVGASHAATYATAGNKTASVHDAGNPQRTATCRATVNYPPPTCAPAAQIVRAGANAAWTATGGAGNYSWAAPGSNQSSPNGASFTARYQTNGTYNVTVTDFGPPLQTARCTVTVRDALPLACAPATQTIAPGREATLNATGGTQPYAWTANGATDAVATNTTYSAQFSGPGESPITLTDATGHAVECKVAVAGLGPPPAEVQQLQAPVLQPNQPGPQPSPNAFASSPGALASGSRPAQLGADPSSLVGGQSVRQGPDPKGVAAAPWGGSGAAQATAAGVAVAAGIGAATARGRIKLPFAGFFTRLRQAKLLDNEVRAQIHAIIKEQPGIHFREITRLVEREQGVVQHHLGILVDGHMIQCHKTLGHTRYFATGIDDPRAIRSLSLLRNSTTKRVMACILENPNSSVHQVADAVELRYATVLGHVKRLRRADLVLAQRKENGLQLFASGLALRIFQEGVPGASPPPIPSGNPGSNRLRQES